MKVYLKKWMHGIKSEHTGMSSLKQCLIAVAVNLKVSDSILDKIGLTVSKTNYEGIKLMRIQFKWQNLTFVLFYWFNKAF